MEYLFLELDPVLKYKWLLGEEFPSSSQGIKFICLKVGLLAGECVPTTLANNVEFGMKQLRYNPKAQTSFIGEKIGRKCACGDISAKLYYAASLWHFQVKSSHLFLYIVLYTKIVSKQLDKAVMQTSNIQLQSI